VWEVSESGNDKSGISDTQLRTLVPIFEEGTVDTDLMEEGRQHIVDYYRGQGYFDATATAKLSPEEDQSVSLEYFVTKGDRHRVRSIRILGSAYFTEAEILKKMKTKQGGSTSRGLFRPELLQADLRMIAAMYQNAGFQSTDIQSMAPDTDSNFDITIQIREGLRSVLNQIIFTGNASFTEPVLWKAAGIQTDQVYSATLIDNAREALSSFYYANGYSDVHVDTHLTFDNANDTVNVSFDVTEGPQYRIAWVLVAGNTHTARKVITRTSMLNANDLYNPEAILEAQQRLYTLGIFNRVEIVTLDQDLGSSKVVLIQVEDTKPVLFTPGLGVTDRSGPRATIELSDINLFGLARTLSFRVRGGQRERQLEGSYRDPRLFNHEILGIAAMSFDKTTHLDTRRPTAPDVGDNVLFRSNEVNFSIQAARKLSKTQTFSLSASYETVNLQDIKSNANIRRFPDTAGLIQIARIGSALIDDHRDNVIDPTKGTFVTNSLEVANKSFGSEVNFISLFSQGSFFKPLPGGVVAASARLGWKQPYGGDVELPISERFFAGGSTTLRGFKLDEAGPPGGGQLLTIANLEYRMPLKFLPVKDLNGGVFYDTGNVFERPSDFGLAEFTHSAGGGLRYKSPLGIIRVDLGFNLRPKPLERRYSAFFTLGHAF
jgi:outer membrane protein insertion porin family